MPWTKASKIKFFQERRKAAIKKFKEQGIPPKDALRLGTKVASQQYQKYKTGFKQIETLSQQIDNLIAKDKKTKKEAKQLDRLETKRNKLARKTHEVWNKWQESIGYKEPSEADVEGIKKAS